MGYLIYIRLIVYTFGTLLQLFWMVVILGYRRQRNFERVFFFLCLGLFFYYGGSLLALNAAIYYSESPTLLVAFSKTVLGLGLCSLPPLLVHLHLEYAETRAMLGNPSLKRLALLAVYLPVPYFALHVYPALAMTPGFDFLAPGNAAGRAYGLWLGMAMLASAAWEMRFARRAPDAPQRGFHGFLAGTFLAGAAVVFCLHVFGIALFVNYAAAFRAVLGALAIPPLAALIYLTLFHRFDFLQMGRQKNLVYAVSATFLALLYLSLVRRVSFWLEPALPPEASASILLFVLVIFIEPLQRLLGRTLHETTQRELDRVQRLTAEFQREARQGNLHDLVRFMERRIREEFELARANLTLRNVENAGGEEVWKCALTNKDGLTAILTSGPTPIAILDAAPHGAALSGETRAALEFLCEQLPAALGLCRLIEDKVRLERELAERERLAVLGHMAASISHNLKNPLGSIKTILQVQMENPELPPSIRVETKMVLDEIGRLSAKLNQLLQFSRPAVRSDSGAGSCNVRTVLQEVAGVLRHEAERRGITLQVDLAVGDAQVGASAEALGDIASNLLVNALEAATAAGQVTLRATVSDGQCVVVVQDDGPGIAPQAREKMLQPFFTTKAQGTGLGLAIVARRVAEFAGRLEWESPAENGRGTRFSVWLPLKSAL